MELCVENSKPPRLPAMAAAIALLLASTSLVGCGLKADPIPPCDNSNGLQMERPAEGGCTGLIRGTSALDHA
jgi:hypothetical protein